MAMKPDKSCWAPGAQNGGCRCDQKGAHFKSNGWPLVDKAIYNVPRKFGNNGESKREECGGM
eukprot:scaffold269191_cov18-Tisochrysis_lutea.AAC.1